MSTGADVEKIIAGYQYTQDAISYADAIVIEAQLNENDDYTMVWTSAYNGAFPPEKVIGGVQ